MQALSRDKRFLFVPAAARRLTKVAFSAASPLRCEGPAKVPVPTSRVEPWNFWGPFGPILEICSNPFTCKTRF